MTGAPAVFRALIFSMVTLAFAATAAHAAQSTQSSAFGDGIDCNKEGVCFCNPHHPTACKDMEKGVCRAGVEKCDFKANPPYCSCHRWRSNPVTSDFGPGAPKPGVAETGPRPGAEIRTGAGLCLDVHAPEIGTNGGRVQAWTCNGSPQQTWSYDPASRAVRISSGLCLDVHAGIQQNGNRVQVWDCNGQSQQQWTPLKNGSLRSAGGLCLDVHAADQATNGARVQIWQCNGSQQQRFTSSAF